MMDRKMKEILKLAGGKENIKQLTREDQVTRMILEDSRKVDMSVPAATDLDATIRITGGECFLTLRDDSSDYYRLLRDMSTGEISHDHPQRETKRTYQKSLSILHFISEVFKPLMPAILGAAVLKIVLAFIALINIYNSSDLSSLLQSQTYMIFKSIGDSAFYLLPILVAVSTAYRLKSNMYVAAAIGGLMFHPQISYILSGEEEVQFMGVPMVSQAAFFSATLWIIMTILAASYVERVVERISPKGLKGIFAPALTFGIFVPLVLMVLGPIGAWIDKRMPVAVNSLLGDAPVVAVMLLGAVFALMLLAGLHYWLFPLILNELMVNGFSVIIPAMLVAYIAQAGAALAAGLRSREPEFRKLAFWAAGTALLGVPEPAIYAVNMRRRASFYAALIGGAIGGLYFGVLSVKSFALSESASLLEIPSFMEDGTLNVLHTCIGLLLAFCASGLLAYWMAGRAAKSKQV
ncbi:PTS transporter subunit EIIC [Paenibacillus xylanilyticus]|uniref:PTS transporter subunit EIIC n=1 Tax=Paenibacillus xylanilyticus TaxID=248903 RepID=A0A7Y6BZD9_9BACL|nr:PTS transporter subunit EIIC [Paenibacillus xylanilyticus]NUU77744.1 PTS transporter subunit EIIC [Paenibacillus xylanilyticus]